jgi:hypothetical protein
VLDGLLLRLIRLRPSIVVSGPLDAGSLLGYFCAFGRLLGVLRLLFAHATSFFPLTAVLIRVDPVADSRRERTNLPHLRV